LVSIHAFRGEGDLIALPGSLLQLVFQSTPSGGKATRRCRRSREMTARFNPRLPGGRRPAAARRMRRAAWSFNPRLPGGRRRKSPSAVAIGGSPFQSTPSGGKATEGDDERDEQMGVSIHAFRGEGDPDAVPPAGPSLSFNPRLPGGRRRERRGQRGPRV